ncbi:chemotaxis protein CheA [Roseobacter sp. GAI101]|uniref:chemotaxis protein CheA n=1 Tax=Roseobacter sp. (strain GAI101) TaxID=391589 RepID=UPI00018720EC|nr:chemotaxis protein CheA [Roseobacter sp. GAI101]EEB83770.1 chemotaxis histidine protein kinase [Roseobacter sp. GAI101]
MSDPEDLGTGIYRQEAAELVQSIEAGLLALENTPGDGDRIDAVFRDLHTVKGSGAMFGFKELAEFVHEFETAFDSVRRREVPVTSALIEISLRACDHILRLLDDPVSAKAVSATILGKLAACLEADGSDALPAPRQDMSIGTDNRGIPPANGYRVKFRLAADALMHGHDPEVLLNDLRDLGPTRVRALVEDVPPLDQLDPTECLMGWEVEITGEIDPTDIEAVFLFTRDTMSLEVSPLDADEALEANAGPTDEPDASFSLVSGASNSTKATGNTMRVATERLDEMMDRVGELVIAEARLQALAQTSGDATLMAVAEDIQRLAAGLRDSTMSIRMVPISSILGRFQRLIRDLSGSLGKQMNFVTCGEDTELDKTVIELLADPLVHILRNCADHGLESAERRLAAGKPATGTIELGAEYAGAEVVITIRDDGRGLDAARIRSRAVERGLIDEDVDLPEAELYRMIFEPGFSTSSAVTELSGRGVGMDVVKRTIASLRGQIDLESEPGHGTTVRLRLPLTLAIIDGLLVEVGGELYTIPLAAVEECVELPALHKSERTTSSFLNIRGGLVPFLRLRSLFDVAVPPSDYQKVVVIASTGARVGLVVDNIIGNNQTVIKQLSPLHAGLKSFSGATILGDGSVALILDVAQLVASGRAIEESTRRENAA